MTTEITMTEKQSQQKKILEHLSKGYTLTPLQAIDVAGTMKLATRISELIRQGYPIVKEWYRTPSGKKVMSYRLMMEAVSKYKIRYKEVGRSRIGEATYSGPLSEDEVIACFGLDGDDVEWYEVEEM